MCDGPPDMNRKMRFFARGAAWATRGANGPATAAAALSLCNKDAKPTMPKPLANVASVASTLEAKRPTRPQLRRSL